MKIFQPKIILLLHPERIGDNNQILGIATKLHDIYGINDIEIWHQAEDWTERIKALNNQPNLHAIFLGTHQHGLDKVNELNNLLGSKHYYVLTSHEYFAELPTGIGLLDLVAMPIHIALADQFYQQNHAKIFQTGGVAHNITKEAITASRTQWEGHIPKSPTYVMVALGGDAGGKKIHDQEANLLATKVARFAKEGNAHIIIATSPRTAKSTVISFINTMNELQADHTLFAWESNKAGFFLAMIAIAIEKHSPFFVTGDSLSMTYELASFLPAEQLYIEYVSSMDSNHVTSAEWLHNHGYAQYHSLGSKATQSEQAHKLDTASDLARIIYERARKSLDTE